MRPLRGTVDMDFWQVLKAYRKKRDPQRRRVYAWERETVGHLDHEPLLGEAADRKITQQGAVRQRSTTSLTFGRRTPSALRRIIVAFLT